MSNFWFSRGFGYIVRSGVGVCSFVILDDKRREEMCYLM